MVTEWHLGLERAASGSGTKITDHSGGKSHHGGANYRTLQREGVISAASECAGVVFGGSAVPRVPTGALVPSV